MRLFLPPRALLEKTDEPELANKVKTIRGEGGEEKDAHIYTWKIDCVNIHFISLVQSVPS